MNVAFLLLVGGGPWSFVMVAALVFVAGSGVWLTLGRRPYAPALETMHKLSAVAACVLVVFLVWSFFGGFPFGPQSIAAISVWAALALASFASGAVITARRDAGPWLIVAHGLAGWLALAAGAAITLLPWVMPLMTLN